LVAWLMQPMKLVFTTNATNATNKTGTYSQ